LEELLLIKLAVTYENFIANIKRFVRHLGSNLARNEKTRKMGYEKTRKSGVKNLCRVGSPVSGRPVDLLLF